VLADLVGADRVVVLAFGQRIDVEQDLLSGEVGGLVGPLDRQRVDAGAIPAARVDRVVLAGLVAGVIPPATLACGDRAVVLLDAPDDLLVEPVLDRLERRHHRVGIGILGFQVGQDRLVLALVVAQPVVLVAALRPVGRLHHVRSLLGVGWRGVYGSGGGGG